MAIGMLVLPVALLVLVAALVLLVSGKGAARWVGLLIVLVVLGGGSLLLIGASQTARSATARFTAPTTDSLESLVPGGAVLAVSGEVSGSGVLSTLTPALDQRLEDAGIRGDDVAVFGGAGGDQSSWFQSRMFGSSGTMEFRQEFSIVEGTNAQAVRSAVQAALFEALGTEEAHGLADVQIDLRMWRAESDGPEAWKLTATETELSWERTESLDLPAPGEGPGAAPSAEAPAVDALPEDEPGGITGG